MKLLSKLVTVATVGMISFGGLALPTSAAYVNCSNSALVSNLKKVARNKNTRNANIYCDYDKKRVAIYTSKNVQFKTRSVDFGSGGEAYRVYKNGVRRTNVNKKGVVKGKTIGDNIVCKMNRQHKQVCKRG